MRFSGIIPDSEHAFLTSAAQIENNHSYSQFDHIIQVINRAINQHNNNEYGLPEGLTLGSTWHRV